MKETLCTNCAHKSDEGLAVERESMKVRPRFSAKREIHVGLMKVCLRNMKFNEVKLTFLMRRLKFNNDLADFHAVTLKLKLTSGDLLDYTSIELSSMV